jgi:hypothetical protein
MFMGGSHRLPGLEICLSENDEDAFRYDKEKHRGVFWVYDPVTNELSSPRFGHPVYKERYPGFIGTPHGLYVTHRGELHHATMKDGEYVWKTIDKSVPPIKGDAEAHPLIYDSKRDRLLQLYGVGTCYGMRYTGLEGDGLMDGKNDPAPFADVHAYSFKTGKWEQLKTSGYAELSRDAVYIEKHDTVLLIGKQKLVALDCATNTWRVIDAKMPEGLSYGFNATMVYDPSHDVVVILLMRNVASPTRVFLFRYDPKTASYRTVTTAEAAGKTPGARERKKNRRPKGDRDGDDGQGQPR